VRTISYRTANYSPGQVPTDPKDFARYLREEFDKLSVSITQLAAGHLDPELVAPDKPRDGDIRYAAGAPNWNPGSGRGLYIYKINVWTFLG